MNNLFFIWNSILSIMVIFLILKITKWRDSWPSVRWSIKDPFCIGFGRAGKHWGSWKWKGLRINTIKYLFRRE